MMYVYRIRTLVLALCLMQASSSQAVLWGLGSIAAGLGLGKQAVSLYVQPAVVQVVQDNSNLTWQHEMVANLRPFIEENYKWIAVGTLSIAALAYGIKRITEKAKDK